MLIYARVHLDVIIAYRYMPKLHAHDDTLNLIVHSNDSAFATLQRPLVTTAGVVCASGLHAIDYLQWSAKLAARGCYLLRVT